MNKNKPIGAVKIRIYNPLEIFTSSNQNRSYFVQSQRRAATGCARRGPASISNIAQATRP